MDSESSAAKGETSAAQGGIDMLDVTVLMGGPSSEREVSLMSGKAIADALERVGHAVTRSDIRPGDLGALGRDGMDVVFIALHGEFGESGDLQRLCEARGLRYTGSAPRASELAMDKAAAKQFFKQAGLNTPDWMIIEEFHPPQVYREWLRDLSLPVVLKPVDGGSSLDVTIARDEATRDDALDALLDDYGRAMLEKFVAGRELTVSILASEALPVLEIVPAREFYDFTAKYAEESGTRYVFDHGLSTEITQAAEEAALIAHRSLGCRDFSRVDFILDENSTLQVLEINTIPGFTSHSLLPMASERAGIGFDELVDRIVRMAMEH